uniref:Uncharacterized protein n=1 Tax=Pithovirus LCDPAC02 TaxID=2506601 RepID=A0A481YPX7_9VIRU|nr:MAG: hypothetical protein LCDPAC02_03180 [Pithovirus LCDPAC02]
MLNINNLKNISNCNFNDINYILVNSIKIIKKLYRYSKSINYCLNLTIVDYDIDKQQYKIEKINSKILLNYDENISYIKKINSNFFEKFLFLDEHYKYNILLQFIFFIIHMYEFNKLEFRNMNFDILDLEKPIIIKYYINNTIYNLKIDYLLKVSYNIYTSKVKNVGYREMLKNIYFLEFGINILNHFKKNNDMTLPNIVKSLNNFEFIDIGKEYNIYKFERNGKCNTLKTIKIIECNECNKCKESFFKFKKDDTISTLKNKFNTDKNLFSSDKVSNELLRNSLNNDEKLINIYRYFNINIFYTKNKMEKIEIKHLNQISIERIPIIFVDFDDTLFEKDRKKYINFMDKNEYLEAYKLPKEPIIKMINLLKGVYTMKYPIYIVSKQKDKTEIKNLLKEHNLSYLIKDIFTQSNIEIDDNKTITISKGQIIVDFLLSLDKLPDYVYFFDDVDTNIISVSEEFKERLPDVNIYSYEVFWKLVTEY